ncbi:MAG: 30S ribosomal protein S1, partial [Planctomycetota bacterium]
MSEPGNLSPDNRDEELQAAELQRELDEALGDMSIEELIAAEEAQDRSGEKSTEDGIRRGKVLAVRGSDVFVDLGGKDQGIVPTEQFEDESPPAEGDEIEVTVDRYDENEGILILSRPGAVRAADWETLEAGQIVEGRVTGHNKGGLELDINGLRAFMPISQIELFRVETLDDYIDQRLQAQVTEVDRREQNVIVSRRALLELEAEKKGRELWETLAEGQVVRGVVRSIVPFGAFVDIGGADGLLHVSDMAHSRVKDPATVLQVGEQIEAKVLQVDRTEQRISLGL